MQSEKESLLLPDRLFSIEHYSIKEAVNFKDPNVFHLFMNHMSWTIKGWKDTVLLMPGEQVRILVAFDDYPGLFLCHCHNLEYEDMGMMMNFYIDNTKKL